MIWRGHLRAVEKMTSMLAFVLYHNNTFTNNTMTTPCYVMYVWVPYIAQNFGGRRSAPKTFLAEKTFTDWLFVGHKRM